MGKAVRKQACTGTLTIRPHISVLTHALSGLQKACPSPGWTYTFSVVQTNTVVHHAPSSCHRSAIETKFNYQISALVFARSLLDAEVSFQFNQYRNNIKRLQRDTHMKSVQGSNAVLLTSEIQVFCNKYFLHVYVELLSKALCGSESHKNVGF